MPNSVTPPTDDLRAECKSLVDSMPDKGVEEMVQSLRDMMEFYSMPEYVPPPETPDVICQGTVVEVVTSKPFELEW